MKRATLCALAACVALGAACAARPARELVARPAAATPTRADPNAWRDTPPALGKPVLVSFPVPQRFTLANGLSLYVMPRHTPVAVLGVVVRHGQSAVPLGKSGLAALTARMLGEGTRRYSALALAEASEALGTTLETDAGRDDSHVSMATLTSDVPRGLELLAEVVLHPAFDPHEFERVQREWLDGLRAERQEPSRLAALVALRARFGAVLGASVAGSIPDVERLRVSDIQAFHRRAYVPSEMAILVVGDVQPREIRGEVERLFGAFHGVPFVEAPPVTTGVVPVESGQAPRVFCVDRAGAVQTSLFAVQPFPERSQAGFEARQVLGMLLGGLFTSRLNHNLREVHAYTYGVHAEAVATRYFGAFIVASDVKTEVTGAALEQILHELRSIRDPKVAPIRDDELERARTDLVHHLGARLEHGGEIADAMRTLYTNGLELDYFRDYPARLAGLERSDIAREAARLDPEHLLVVLVGDRAQVRTELAAQGLSCAEAQPSWLE